MNNNIVPFTDRVENNYWNLCNCLANAISDDLIFEEDALFLMRKIGYEIWNGVSMFGDEEFNYWEEKHNNIREQYDKDSLIWRLTELPMEREYPLSEKTRIHIVDDNFIILLGCLYIFTCHGVITRKEMEQYVSDFTKKELEYISNSQLDYEDTKEIMNEHFDKFNDFTRAMYEDDDEGYYNVALDVV